MVPDGSPSSTSLSLRLFVFFCCSAFRVVVCLFFSSRRPGSTVSPFFFFFLSIRFQQLLRNRRRASVLILTNTIDFRVNSSSFLSLPPHPVNYLSVSFLTQSLHVCSKPAPILAATSDFTNAFLFSARQLLLGNGLWLLVRLSVLSHISTQTHKTSLPGFNQQPIQALEPGTAEFLKEKKCKKRWFFCCCFVFSFKKEKKLNVFSPAVSLV